MGALERDLRKILRDQKKFPPGSVSFIEPARGSDFGLPDTMVLIGGLFIPIELKRGPSVVKELRPSQKVWHKLSISMGGRTYGATLDGSSVKLYEIRLPGGSLSNKLEEQLLWVAVEDEFCHDSLSRFFLTSHK